MKKRYCIAWVLGVLAALVPMVGWGADAVVEFYRTQPNAGRYDLHETSVYELRRNISDSYDHARDFWRRAAEKFAAYPEAVRLCEDHERAYERSRQNEEKWLEREIAPLTADGNRVFYFGYQDEKDSVSEKLTQESDGRILVRGLGGRRSGGKLVLTSDGSILWRCVTWESGGGWSDRQSKAWRRTIEKKAAELETDTAAAFLRNRPDAAAHSLHATSEEGLKLYLIFPDFNPGPPEVLEEWAQDFAGVPGFLEFAETEDAALMTWLAPREAIVKKLKAEAEPTDRLYWDEFDDGEHRRAGLLWLRWDGSVRQEWPYFGEAGDPLGEKKEPAL